MSVPKRKRGLSEFEFWQNGKQIAVEVFRIVHNENMFPKRYRLYGLKVLDRALDLMDDLTEADEHYPSSPNSAAMRRECLTRAISDTREVMRLLQVYKEARASEAPKVQGAMERLADMCDREIALLKGARKAVRVTGRQSTSERIAALEKELADMKALQ